nr:hypothetical protein OH837_40740 [Streptomyces canus]
MTTTIPLQHGRCRTHDPVGDNDEPTHTSETLTVTLVHAAHERHDERARHHALAQPGGVRLLRHTDQ